MESKVDGRPSLNWPPPTVQDCIDSCQILSSFAKAHASWQAVDYRQILEWSQAILNRLPASSGSNGALQIIAQAALDIQRSAGSQHHDLVGITFCQSVESAKNDGSMYTTIPAATMLLNLLFDGLDIDWTDFEQVAGLRVVDFACGTGTLLIAAANYIIQTERTGKPKQIAKQLLEQVLYGFDINNRAVFQSATGLGMISPSVQFRNMHLYGMMLDADPDTGEGRLGSLELLRGLDQGSFIPKPPTAERIDSAPAPIEVDKFDVAVMNPPYTRADLRHQQLDEKAKIAVRKREKELTKALPSHGSSNANNFFALAEKHLKRDRGRMGFVAPSVTASNPSSAKTRRYLGKSFHVAYLVMTYDPDRIFNSGNTKIGEMLVVLERLNGERKPTTVVKLISNPATASDAIVCAKSILSEEALSNDWGTVDCIQRDLIEKGDWSATQFFDNELHEIAKTELWKARLGNQIRIGTLGSTIRTNTEKCDETELGATPAVYDHKVKRINAMEVEPDCHVKPKDKSKSSRAAVAFPTTLHLPERIRLTTVKSFVVRTREPAVGSAWMCANPVDVPGGEAVTVEKAVCVILNSSPGKLGMLLVRNNHTPSYPKFAKENLEQTPFPRLRDLEPSQIRALAKAYDLLASHERLRLPSSHNCRVQSEIDRAVCDELEFDSELCARIRHLIVQEPMVSGAKELIA